MIFTETERMMEMAKQFNLREDREGSKPINVTATALKSTVNIHY